MMAWALSAFSWVNTKGVSALFSGVSLWTTRVSPPHLAVVVDREREADLARPEKRVLTNMISLKQKMLTILTQNINTKITLKTRRSLNITRVRPRLESPVFWTS